MVLDLPTDFSNRLEKAAQESGLPPTEYLVAVVSRLWNGGTNFQTSGFADENDTPISHEKRPLCFRGFYEV